MAHDTPYVADALLSCAAYADPIPVESAAWWHWLDEATNTTFRFTDQPGDFTARSEWKHGSRYWYAYRRRNKKLYKAYLGRSTDLVLIRLRAVAQQLVEQSSMIAPYCAILPRTNTRG